MDAIDVRLAYINRGIHYHEGFFLKPKDIEFLIEKDSILVIQEKIETFCFDTGLMKVDQTLAKNRFCTDLLHNYITINQLRDIIIISFVNKAYKSEQLRSLALYVLDVNKERKTEMR